MKRMGLFIHSKPPTPKNLQNILSKISLFWKKKPTWFYRQLRFLAKCLLVKNIITLRNVLTIPVHFCCVSSRGWSVWRECWTTGLSQKILEGGWTPDFSQQCFGSVIHASSNISRDHSTIVQEQNCSCME